MNTKLSRAMTKLVAIAFTIQAILNSQAQAALLGFEAENGNSVTTTVAATIGADYLPADSDVFALGGEYLSRDGNGETGGFPGSAANLLSYDVNFAEAGEYDLYARLLFEVDGGDDSFYYGNGFGVKTINDSADWVRPNGLPDAGFPAASYFWINLSENIGAFPAGTATTFNVAAPGTQTIQFGGREDGLYFDAFAFGTSTDEFTDSQLNASVTNVIPSVNEWTDVVAGNFGDGANWSEGTVPTADAFFGNMLVSGDATVTLQSNATLNTATFANAANQYTLVGPGTLGLSEAVVAGGTHQIDALIVGSSGLIKTGGGNLILSGANTFTGVTDVREGTLRLNTLAAVDNQASGSINIAAGTTVVVEGGATGTLAAELTGTSTAASDATFTYVGSEPADTLTIARSNSSFGGVIRVNGGTLNVANANALGTGGVSNNRTVVQAGTDAKIALTGGVTIANEVLDFEGRATDDPALTNSGSNAWNGVIRGEGNNNISKFNIESTSGTLTLNQLYADDGGEGGASNYTYVFSGAGNTTINGRISDASIDIDSGIVSVKENDNVGVTKRGSGTLRIGYATAEENDYWFGPTVIEEGTLDVAASGGTVGELRSSSITIKSGATLDVSEYTEYTQQIGQALRGSGAINVGSGNLRLIDAADLAPGDDQGKVGELTVSSGTATLPNLSLGGGGTWSFDIGNNTDTSGDLLNVQSGSFSATTSGITLNVTPAHGHLDAGSRTIVSHTGGTNPTLNSVVAQITDASGNVLNTRQSVSVNGNTAGQVNVVVTGEEQSRTWNGNVSNSWDTATSNWVGGDSQFRDLDHVTFNDSASTTDVSIETSRASGSVTFANSTPYTFSGTGGIVGSGDIDVTGTGQVTLGNSGNNFTGTTTVNAGSSLRMAAASTGSIVNSGNFSLGVEETVDVLVQNDAATIGTGGYKVFAFEAEHFQGPVTENAPGDTTWIVRNDIAGSSGSGASGEALYATEDPSNTGTSTANKNFVTYNLKFTEPGSYMWFFHGVSTDGGNPGPTPDGDAGNDDSFYTVTADMDSGNTDPQGLGSRVDNFGSGRLAAEGVIEGSTGSLTYDWYRNGDSGSNAGEFHRINVDQSDVDAGTVFKFKVGTREGGMTLDKFVFVADADYATDPNFGTVTDMNLDDAISILETQDTFVAAGTLLDVNGDFTMADGSTLSMLLSSTNLHDQLDISGMLSADGTLDIGVGGSGFAAEAGDVFDIFNFESAIGAFDDILLPALAGGLAWDTTNLLVTGELSVFADLMAGDFDEDGDVDGQDFLLWQRNPAVGNLADWQANYGGGGTGVAGVANVPEPTSVILLLVSVLATSVTTRRRS